MFPTIDWSKTVYSPATQNVYVQSTTKNIHVAKKPKSSARLYSHETCVARFATQTRKHKCNPTVWPRKKSVGCFLPATHELNDNYITTKSSLPDSSLSHTPSWSLLEPESPLPFPFARFARFWNRSSFSTTNLAEAPAKQIA